MKLSLPSHLSPVEHTVLNELSNRLEDALGSKLRKIILFGSKARGDFDVDSDIDVFVVVDKRNYIIREIVSGIVSDLMIEYGVFLSTNIRDFDEIFQLQQYKVKFLENLNKDGIEIWTSN